MRLNLRREALTALTREELAGIAGAREHTLPSPECVTALPSIRSACALPDITGKCV